MDNDNIGVGILVSDALQGKDVTRTWWVGLEYDWIGIKWLTITRVPDRSEGVPQHQFTFHDIHPLSSTSTSMPMSSLFNRVSTLPSYISSLLSTSSPQQHDTSRTILHWVTQLEREAGVTSSSNLDSYNSTNTTEAVVVTGVAGPGPSTLNRRLEQSPIPRRPFPEFYMGSYEDALRTAQADAVTLCVVLVSDEHDDVAYFVKWVLLSFFCVFFFTFVLPLADGDRRRNTLTDPKFNQLLKDNRMIVWGGDVKHYEAHQGNALYFTLECSTLADKS